MILNIVLLIQVHTFSSLRSPGVQTKMATGTTEPTSPQLFKESDFVLELAYANLGNTLEKHQKHINAFLKELIRETMLAAQTNEERASVRNANMHYTLEFNEQFANLIHAYNQAIGVVRRSTISGHIYNNPNLI